MCQGNPTKEDKAMRRNKIVIACLCLLFCGSAVGQIDSSERTDYFEGVIWGIDSAIIAIEGMDTKEGMIRELWKVRKMAADAVHKFEADAKQSNKESEEYIKRMMERIEAADSTEEFDKLIEEVETNKRRIEEEMRELERKMK